MKGDWTAETLKAYLVEVLEDAPAAAFQEALSAIVPGLGAAYQLLYENRKDDPLRAKQLLRRIFANAGLATVTWQDGELVEVVFKEHLRDGFSISDTLTEAEIPHVENGSGFTDRLDPREEP